MPNIGRYQVHGDAIVSSHHRTLKAAINKAVLKAKEKIGHQPSRIIVTDKEEMATVFTINIPKRRRR